MTKQDREDLALGRMARLDAERKCKEWAEKLKRSCPLCGKEKHGGWPCD